MLPFESNIISRASNSEKRVAKFEEYQSLHELYEPALYSTLAHLLRLKKTKQFLNKDKHTQLSFLSQDHTDISQKESEFSTYGDDFLDKDFFSLFNLVN